MLSLLCRDNGCPGNRTPSSIATACPTVWPLGKNWCLEWESVLGPMGCVCSSWAGWPWQADSCHWALVFSLALINEWRGPGHLKDSFIFCHLLGAVTSRSVECLRSSAQACPCHKPVVSIPMKNPAHIYIYTSSLLRSVCPGVSNTWFVCET